MYYTDDSLLPENPDPLIITASPYGPIWMPADSASIVGSGFSMSHQSGKPGSSICTRTLPRPPPDTPHARCTPEPSLTNRQSWSSWR